MSGHADQVVLVECLSCRHRAVLTDAHLRRRGLCVDTQLATITAHLVYRECASRSVRAEWTETGQNDVSISGR